MSPFSRALKYPLRHKRYLLVTMTCVLLGALCYGGGIGTIFPVLKLVISQEGPHGWADIRMSEEMMGVIFESNNFAEDTKVELDKVESDSPAELVGLKIGDIIQAIDGVELDLPSFVCRVAQMEASQSITLRGEHEDGTEFALSIDLQQPRLDVRIVAVLTNLLPRGLDNRFAALVYIMLAFWLVNIMQSITRFMQDYSASVMIERGLLEMRTKVYSNALRLPLKFYDLQGGSSDVASRFVQDSPTIKRGMKVLFTQAMLEPFKFLAALGLALYCSWKLTLIVMTVAPLVLLLVNKLGQAMKKATHRSLQVWGNILGLLNETLSNIRVVKAYGNEEYENQRFFQANSKLLKYLIRIARVESLTSPTVAMLGITMATVGLLFACKLVLPPDRTMKPEVLFTFFGGIFGMAESLRKLSSVPNKLQSSNAAAERFFNILDQQKEHEEPGAPELPPLSREIEFENVSFSYPGANVRALKDIDLVIPKGQTVALVGPNGSGKTTLISLLPRFFDTDAGRILFDGQDIHKVTLRSLRKQMAMVTQQTVVFADTVAANIAYGQPQIAQEKIIDAAKRAHAHEFIELLPQGYDTVLNEGGENLSGGQRQRISIARAILRDPEILILDEATSNIDADSEAKITQALAELTASRTCLIVAHRFATVMAADFIAVIDKGKIVAKGTHDELVASCPLYHGLYETQFTAGELNN